MRQQASHQSYPLFCCWIKKDKQTDDFILNDCVLANDKYEIWVWLTKNSNVDDSCRCISDAIICNASVKPFFLFTSDTNVPGTKLLLETNIHLIMGEG